MSDGEWAIIAIEQCGRIVKYHMHVERMLQDIANRSGLQQIVHPDRKGREDSQRYTLLNSSRPLLKNQCYSDFKILGHLCYE